ncbi:SusC/RagA family TonB-linked outer membrane protein [Pseudobacter ginsenosidimutans]|uniref:TonB-linked SusC/RagA family outer membrane protein n=1 Tax=Pseudobacter ginsenosidimutans TaxID=661488 RepID=A0A4Q7N4G4_9BACT|nr:SusC/RagA family TonB-linked outer membrane protein [Pseudobacter ginsenosidimutans]RZS75902.1 TonB-linked SusC/RagA family outer membrane protein [Pseudobacter ginsenosidimutans]
MPKTAFCRCYVLPMSIPERGGKRLLTKTLLVMKLTILLLTVSILHANAGGFAQSISLQGKNLPVEQVIKSVEKQTGYVFLYSREVLANTRTITIDASNTPLKEFLQQAFRDQPFRFSIRSKTILLLQKTMALESIDLPKDSIQNIPEAIKVNGQVFGVNNQPLIGASVRKQGTKEFVLTDHNGRFVINAEIGSKLLVSYVGYELYEWKVTGPQVRIPLQLVVNDLDQTVVTAYGKTTKRLATGNISTVKGEDIQRQPVMTVLEALVGRVPGLIVNQTSGNGAAPVSLLIRGRNTINSTVPTDPLYVIDGVPLTYLNVSTSTSALDFSPGAVQSGVSNTNGENPLLSINPNDIERVDVLKDADATAIYGSRGANGVVLITTKKAKAGPPSFNISIGNGLKFNQRYPKLLSTPEYLAIRREALQNDGIAADIYSAPDLMLWDTTKYTDWQREMIGVGNMLNVNIGVGGGTTQTSYALSAGFRSQKELMNNDGKNNVVNLLTSVNHSGLNQKFKLSFGNSMAVSDVKSYALGLLTDIPPNAPDIYTEKGDFNFIPYRGRTSSLFYFSRLKSPSESKSIKLGSQLNISYQIIKGLIISASGGHNFSNNQNRAITPAASRDTLYRNAPGAYYGRSTQNDFNIEPQLAYSTMLGKGNLSVQLIGTYFTSTARAETIHGTDFTNDALMKSYNNAGTKTVSEGFRQYKYLSAAAILRYIWDNKYIINLNAKRDGSSRFGPGKQFGNFASVGAAWISSDERWMKAVLPKWISLLKFRGSVGATGSDNVGEFEYLSQWGTAPADLNPLKLFRYNGVDAYHVLKPLNQEFQWETTFKSEFGASLGFLNDRVLLEFAAYRNISSNQLTNMPTGLFTGFASTVTNLAAKIANTGIEFQMTAKLIERKDFNLSVDFNISRNRNRLLEFPGIENSIYNNRLRVGQPTTVEYLLRYTGIDPLTGSHSFEDYNKDGVITAGSRFFLPTLPNEDRYITIDKAPKYFGSTGLNISYKDFSISTRLDFKNQLREDPYLTAIVGSMKNISLPAEILNNHWRNPGDIVKYPRFTTEGTRINSNNLDRSDAKYVNGSFLRMNNLSIAYRFPQSWCKKIGVKNIGISINTQNLFTISPYKGLEPDLQTSIYATPIPRTISTNLRLNF